MNTEIKIRLWHMALMVMTALLMIGAGYERFGAFEQTGHNAELWWSIILFGCALLQVLALVSHLWRRKR